MNKFLKKQLNLMIKDAIITAKDNGREICGLLIDNQHFIELIKVNNKASKGGSFIFDKKEIIFLKKAASMMNHEIIGTFHSHPFDVAVPGVSDIENALDDSYMLVIAVMNKEAILWHIKNGRKKRIKYEKI